MNFSNEFLRSVSNILHTVEQTGEIPQLFSPFFLLGNGGSAAVAEHICNDLNKNGNAAFVPNYASLTCLANDYSWGGAMERWVQNQPVGTFILISSSGQSANICNAAAESKNRGLVITLSGFNEDNKLRQIGNVNFYVPSRNYGVVEIAHLAILHSLFNPG